MKAVVKDARLYPNPANPSQTIAVGSAAWHRWLAEHDCFIYHAGANRQFSARREVVRGGTYWYGYRRQGGRLRKVYLGKSCDLTLERLIATDQKLRAQEEAEATSLQPFSPTLDKALRTVVVSATPTEALATTIPLTIRLIPPALPASLVTRPRLTQRFTSPIILITAPSGFGKTTLLSQWRAERMKTEGVRVVWVSLEVEERNVYTFWMAIVTALQQLDVSIDENVSILLRSPAPQPIEQILASLINNLNRWQEGQSRRQIALIIDNYQWVRSPDIDVACQFFLDHLPSAVQVIMASQTQFPFSVQRWRAQGALTELTSEDLRLTPEEGVAWLDRSVPIPLTDREKLSLVVRAEGWAAGLNLLRLALERQDDVHRFIATFDGHHPFLQTYFVEEILRKLPADQQSFLLQTSILKNLDGSLCDAVTERTGSAQILQQLYQANLFISLVDKERGWYQYHELFAQALQHQLQSNAPQQIPDLHRRAAAWYEEHGLYSEVIHHLLQAGAWPELGQIIEQVILDELRRGSDDRVLRWIQQLPDELFLHHSTLLLTYARLAMPSLPESQTKNLLNRITARIEATPPALRTSGQQALLARLDEWEHTVAMGYSPHPPEPSARDIEQVGYLLDLYYQARCCLIRQGKIAASEKVLRQALELGQAQGVVFIVLSVGGILADLIAMQGRLSEGETLARNVLQYALAQSGTLTSCASIPLTVLGKICYTRNQIAQARQFIDDAVKLDPHPTSLNMVIHHHLLLAHLLSAQGDKTSALATLQAVVELEPYTTQTITAQDLKVYQALFYLRQKQTALAEQLLRQVSIYPLPAQLAQDGLLRMAWAELFLAQQQYEEAETILTQPSNTSFHTSSFNVLPYMNLLLAQAYWEQHKFVQARQEMMRAIRMAEPEGIIRPFLDHGDQIIPLLTDILHIKSLSVVHRRFVSQLIDQFRVVYPDLPILSLEEMAVPAPMRLSPREREILQLLDEGLDNKALARRLVVADSTVRTHLRSIYRKLRVSSRLQAVKRARESRLL